MGPGASGVAPELPTGRDGSAAAPEEFSESERGAGVAEDMVDVARWGLGRPYFRSTAAVQPR